MGYDASYRCLEALGSKFHPKKQTVVEMAVQLAYFTCNLSYSTFQTGLFSQTHDSFIPCTDHNNVHHEVPEYTAIPMRELRINQASFMQHNVKADFLYRVNNCNSSG